MNVEVSYDRLSNVHLQFTTDQARVPDIGNSEEGINLILGKPSNCKNTAVSWECTTRPI